MEGLPVRSTLSQAGWLGFSPGLVCAHTSSSCWVSHIFIASKVKLLWALLCLHREVVRSRCSSKPGRNRLSLKHSWFPAAHMSQGFRVYSCSQKGGKKYTKTSRICLWFILADWESVSVSFPVMWQKTPANQLSRRRLLGQFERPHPGCSAPSHRAVRSISGWKFVARGPVTQCPGNKWGWNQNPSVARAQPTI